MLVLEEAKTSIHEDRFVGHDLGGTMHVIIEK
jgi:hypothetical protein